MIRPDVHGNAGTFDGIQAGNRMLYTSAEPGARSEDLTNLEVFQRRHPEEWEWIKAKRKTFQFAEEMAKAINPFGDLTIGQMAAIRNCMERDRAKAGAPALTVAKIEQAFKAAKGAGIQAPKLRLDVFLFSPAPAGSKNPGAIYVKEEGTYLGKVMGGKFLRSRDCTDDQERRIVAAASSPLESAVANGKRTGQCAVCNRPLAATGSIDLGIGPICRDRMGWFE